MKSVFIFYSKHFEISYMIYKVHDNICNNKKFYSDNGFKIIEKEITKEQKKIV
uniref:Uncharacterized protein n=1 Tax=viral metagenome TaxID=1070528 RepID=A0A6C0ADL1_9ZZZZ